jgi:hypothetical protein
MKLLKERLSIRMAICVHGTSEIRKKNPCCFDGAK